MEKRIIVAGCREYEDYEEAKVYIASCLRQLPHAQSFVFLSGGCRGADALGERFARENGFPIERYPADWKRYGKGAGLKRNLQMVEKCDYAICFWDGKSRGTASLIAYAQKLHKPVMIKKISLHMPLH